MHSNLSADQVTIVNHSWEILLALGEYMSGVIRIPTKHKYIIDEHTPKHKHYSYALQ